METAFGYEAVNMGMEDHGLAPGVQCSDDAWFAADMSCIGEDLKERVSYAGKEQIGHGLYIQKPQFIEFMREGEDHMVVGTGKDSPFLFFEPLFYTNPIALGAESMAAGIIPLSLVMTFRTCLHMTAKLCGAALHKGLCCLADIERELMGPLITVKCLFHYLLNGCPRHKDCH